MCDTPIARTTCQTDVNNALLKSWLFLAVQDFRSMFASKRVPRLLSNHEHVDLTGTEQTTDDREVCTDYPCAWLMLILLGSGKYPRTRTWSCRGKWQYIWCVVGKIRSMPVLNHRLASPDTTNDSYYKK